MGSTLLMRWRTRADRAPHQAAPRRRPAFRRPLLEALEERTLPSNSTAASVSDLIKDINRSNVPPPVHGGSPCCPHRPAARSPACSPAAVRPPAPLGLHPGRLPPGPGPSPDRDAPAPPPSLRGDHPPPGTGARRPAAGEVARGGPPGLRDGPPQSEGDGLGQLTGKRRRDKGDMTGKRGHATFPREELLYVLKCAQPLAGLPFAGYARR
jgi:hypothetical protein